MSDEPGTLRKIVWHEVFPGVILFHALRLAVSMRVLVLAALGLFITAAGWILLAMMLVDSDDPVNARFAHWPWESAPSASLIPLPGNDSGMVGVSVGNFGFSAHYLSPSLQVVRQLSDPIVALFTPGPTRPSHFVLLLLGGLWSLAVWSLFGGAITRIAALALARDKRVPAGDAIGYARVNWLNYFTAPLYPILGALLATIPLILFGLLLQFAFGVLMAGILWPIVVVVGAFMAVLLVGLFFGWPLMWATISTEGTDSFDALSSSYSYVYQRPLHYVFYIVVAGILGVVGWALVSLFAEAVISLGVWGVSWGSGHERIASALDPAVRPEGMAQAGVVMIRFWVGCVRLLAVAFISAYFWTAATAIYFLLRRHVDNTELDEAFTTKSEETFGLPPLQTDAQGVTTTSDTANSPEGT